MPFHYFVHSEENALPVHHYYLQVSLGYTPVQTGLSFLPMIAMLVVAAQLSTNVFVPRFGPNIMVPFGMTLGALGMIYAPIST